MQSAGWQDASANESPKKQQQNTSVQQRNTHTDVVHSSTYDGQTYGGISSVVQPNVSPSGALPSSIISHSATTMTSYQHSYVPPPEITQALSAQVLDMLDKACDGGLTIEQKIKTVESILEDAMREQAQHTIKQPANNAAAALQQTVQISSSASHTSTNSARVPSHSQSKHSHASYQSQELQLQLLRQQQYILQQQIERQAKLQPLYQQPTTDQRPPSSPSASSASSFSVETHVHKKMKPNHHSPSNSFAAASSTETVQNQVAVKMEPTTTSAVSPNLPASMPVPPILALSTNLPPTDNLNAAAVSPVPTNSAASNATRGSASKKKKKNKKTSRDISLDSSISMASPLIEDRMLSNRAFSKICLQNFLTLDILKTYTNDFESDQTSKAAVQQYLSWLSSQLEADEKISLIENFTALSIADGRMKPGSTIDVPETPKGPVVAGDMLHDATSSQQTHHMQIEDSMSFHGHSTEQSLSTATSSGSSPVSSFNSISILSTSSSPASSTKQTLPHNIRLMDVDSSLLSPERAIADDLDGLARWKLTMVIPSDLSKKRKQPTPPLLPPPSSSPMDESDDASSRDSSVSAKDEDDDEAIVSHPLHGIIQVNRAWERLTGFTQDYMVNLSAGERPFKFLRSDFVPAAHRLMLFVQMNKMTELIKQYVVIVRKDGTEQYCLEAWRLSFDERGIFLALSDMITPLPSSESVPPFVAGREMNEATLIYGYNSTISKQMHWKDKILSQKSGNTATTLALTHSTEPAASITPSSSDILSVNASALSSATLSTALSSASSSATSV